jgi:hypothetical protein
VSTSADEIFSFSLHQLGSDLDDNPRALELRKLSDGQNMRAIKVATTQYVLL